MERPVNCRFCGTKLENMPAFGWTCLSTDCTSFDGLTRSKTTIPVFSIIDELNRKRVIKRPPLTSNDILDIRIWTKQVKNHELHHFTRAKRKA